MAQKQDPPKKIMNGPKGTMTPPSRKKMLERVDKVIKKTVKPKPKNTLGAALARGAGRAMARGAVSAMLPKTNALKSALAKGDQSSASSSFTARAAKKVAMGAGKALKSIAAKKDSTSNSISSRINSIVGGKKKVAPSVKIDSTKKVMPGGGSKPSVIIKKETKIRGTKPIDETFRKKMQAWDKLPKVEYKPLPKK